MGQTAGFKIENSIWPRINEKSSSNPRFERNWNWFTDDINSRDFIEADNTTARWVGESGRSDGVNLNGPRELKETVETTASGRTRMKVEGSRRQKVTGPPKWTVSQKDKKWTTYKNRKWTAPNERPRSGFQIRSWFWVLEREPIASKSCCKTEVNVTPCFWSLFMENIQK